MPQKNRRFSYQVFLAIAIVMLATLFAPPFLRILGDRTWTSLGISEGQWSIIMAARGLLFIVFILAAGVAGDLWGRRRMFLLSLGAFILCIPVLIFKETFSIPFIIMYTFWAILGVMVRTLALTFLILEFESDERIFALVIYSVLTGAGFLLSPILARFAMQQVGFHAVFIAPLLLSLLGIALAKKYIPESRASYDFWRLDAFALAGWTFGLCLMIFAGVLAGSLGWSSPLVLAALGIGAALILSIRRLSKRRAPDKWQFKLRYDNHLGIAIFAGVVLYLSLYAIAVQVFNFLSRVQNFHTILSGIALAPILIGALLSLLAARKLIRWEIGQAMAAGLAVIAIPAVILSLLQPDISYWVLLPCLLLLGFGFILSNSPRLLLLSTSMPRNLSATVQAIGDATAHLGSALAYSFMITLLERFGMRAYVQTLESFGLSDLQIAIRISTMARVSEDISVIAPAEEQLELLHRIDFWIVQSYVVGLSRAMLALAAVCLFSAAVVYFGLYLSDRKSKQLEP